MSFKKKEIENMVFTFIVGLVAHFFIISNPLFNADGIFYNRSFGGGSIFGRWLIEILNILSEKIGYSSVIPMLNVVIAILIISFASIYLLRVLEIENDIYKKTISCTLVLSPAIVQTFFYGFTAHIYAFAIFFTILSTYYIFVKHNYVVSIYLNVLALALYQAYIPFMLTLYILLFIKLLINNDIKKCLIVLCKCIVSFLIAFAMYMMLNSIINSRNENYIFAVHGMSEYVVPRFTFVSLMQDILKCYTAVFDMIFHHNVFAHNTTLLIRCVYMIIYIITILSFVQFIYLYAFKRSLYQSERKIVIKKSIIITILYILSPIAINFMFIMTNNGIGYVEDRMAYSYVFYIIFPLYFLSLSEQFPSYDKNMKSIQSKIAIAFTSFILVHNIWLAYGSYYNQYKIINASKSFALELATTIKMLPGYMNDTKVLFIGSPYVKNSHYNYGYYVDAEHNLYSNFDVEYENILSEYPMKQIFKEFTALNFEDAESDFTNNMYYSKAVREMPLYPIDGSVKLIENVAVVKFQEPKY